MKQTRKRHNAEFKAKVALAALKGDAMLWCRDAAVARADDVG